MVMTRRSRMRARGWTAVLRMWRFMWFLAGDLALIYGMAGVFFDVAVVVRETPDRGNIAIIQ